MADSEQEQKGLESDKEKEKATSTSCGGTFDIIGGPLNVLLVAIPIAGIIWGLNGNQVAQFVFSALAVIPLAGIMGDATETIAEFSGPGVGGLLNATFGNAAELILGLFSVFNHLDCLVKASITGSIIGNVLLVMGMSMFAGGCRHKTQSFNKTAIGTSATVCVAASIAIVIPAVTSSSSSKSEEQNLSVAVSVILILSYAVMLWFSLVTHKELFDADSSGEEKTKEDARRESGRESGGEKQMEMTETGAGGRLPSSSTAVAWMSEVLVGAVEEAGKSIGVSEIFMGVIIVAIVGNAAEHAPL